MRSILAFVTLCMVAVSLFATSMAHASEGIICVDGRTAIELGHANGDGDQVPADEDKGYPHHHGSCHGHQATSGRACEASLVARLAQKLPAPGKAYILPAAMAGPALRPPKA